MNKLVKKFETDTDFTICVYENQDNGRFAVTTYDTVSGKHEEAKWYETIDEALIDAKNRVKGYRLNENKQIIKINESQLSEMVKKAVNKILKENDVMAGFDDEIDPDDWQSEEPTEDEVNKVIMAFQNKANELGLNFRDLGEKEFAVTCKIGPDGKATCDIKPFLEMATIYVNRGILNVIGHGISKSGTWYQKYRVIKGLPTINEEKFQGSNRLNEVLNQLQSVLNLTSDILDVTPYGSEEEKLVSNIMDKIAVARYECMKAIKIINNN